MFLMQTNELVMFLTAIPRSLSNSAWPSCPSVKDSVHTKPLVTELELEIDALETVMFQLLMILECSCFVTLETLIDVSGPSVFK